jgi:hypothetical protein
VLTGLVREKRVNYNAGTTLTPVNGTPMPSTISSVTKEAISRGRSIQRNKASNQKNTNHHMSPPPLQEGLSDEQVKKGKYYSGNTKVKVKESSHNTLRVVIHKKNSKTLNELWLGEQR